jgi:hypothetical protein
MQPRITRPTGCESDVINEINGISKNKVIGECQGDASELVGSDGTTNTGNSRGVTGNNHENSPGIIRDDSLGHYEVYVVSPQLKEMLGIALIDSGSQVSLIKEASLVKFNKRKNENIQIQGVTGKQMNVKGQINLKTENT